MQRRILLAFALAAGGLPSPALHAQAPAVAAQNVWARATALHASTGAIYMTLTSPSGDRLTGVSSPAAAKAEVHETRMDGNVMRMRPVEGGLDLPAGKPVALAPGGYHVMLQDLKQPLTRGQTVPLHLTFEHAAPLDVVAEVQPIGASGPGGQGAGHGGAHGGAQVSGMPMHGAATPGTTMAK